MTQTDQDFIKSFSFFQHLPLGRFELWSSDRCEACNTEVEAPNSADIGFSGDAVWVFKKLGLTERSKSDCPMELYWSEDLGAACCDECCAKYAD